MHMHKHRKQKEASKQASKAGVCIDLERAVHSPSIYVIWDREAATHELRNGTVLYMASLMHNTYMYLQVLAVSTYLHPTCTCTAPYMYICISKELVHIQYKDYKRCRQDVGMSWYQKGRLVHVIL